MPSNTFVVAHEVIARCRSCASHSLVPVLDLGTTPLADRLLDDRTLEEPEPVCPLTVLFCRNCALMQIGETVDPTVLFGVDYPYYSSVSVGLLRHFADTVAAARKRRAVTSSSLVVELASNDGALLRNYLADSIPVLGIDPAPGPSDVARSRGINTVTAFFTPDLAERLAAEGRYADIVHCNNVLPHVADTNGFVRGISSILKDDGLLVVECAYVRDLVDHCEFNTIYHQHLCYFSVTALDHLLRRHGLFVVDVERVPVHGGSLRVFASKRDLPAASVTRILSEERALGIDQPPYYQDLASRTTALRRKLRGLVDGLKLDGLRIAGYGAAAKACTLLSFTGIGPAELDCIVDKTPFKQGRYFPGNHLLIRHPNWLLAAKPDVTLIMPWNFANEIMAEQAEYARRGGRFIIPVPDPVIADPVEARPYWNLAPGL